MSDGMLAAAAGASLQASAACGRAAGMNLTQLTDQLMTHITSAALDFSSSHSSGWISAAIAKCL